jgi:hypothetical protein
MILIEWSLVDTTITIMSSKDITSHIPMFASQDYRFWKESMTDYLGAQRLLGYALGQRQRPVTADVAQPTQAELAAQADWDEIDLQVRSMISMQLSTNLRTLIGTTSMLPWTNLEQCYGVPHFTGIYKDYELAHSIKLSVDENSEIRIQKIWTILERLWANGCDLNNYLQGMLLLKAIPKEWDTVAQMYCNSMQWLMSPLMVYGTPSWQSLSGQLALPNLHTRQTRYLL